MRVASFRFEAMPDGVTLCPRIIPIGMLAQQMNTTTGAVTPAWGNDNNHGFYVKVMDTAKGSDGEMESLCPKLVYMGVEITFPNNTGNEQVNVNSGNATLNGLFKRVQQTVDGVKRWHYYYTRSPFSLNGNDDSDAFYVEGKVVLDSGTEQSYRTQDSSVTLLKTSGSASRFYVQVDATDITETGPGVLKASLFDLSGSGSPITSGFSTTWYNMDGSDPGDPLTNGGDYTISGTGNSVLEVAAGDSVQGDDCFMAKISYGGAEYYGFASLRDLTDGFQVGYEISFTGKAAPPSLWRGSEITVVAKVYDVKDDSVRNDINLYMWVHIHDHGGTPIPNSKVRFESGKCTGTFKFTYGQMVGKDTASCIDWNTSEINGNFSLEKTLPTGSNAYHSLTV